MFHGRSWAEDYSTAPTLDQDPPPSSNREPWPGMGTERGDEPGVYPGGGAGGQKGCGGAH